MSILEHLYEAKRAFDCNVNIIVKYGLLMMLFVVLYEYNYLLCYHGAIRMSP